MAITLRLDARTRELGKDDAIFKHLGMESKRTLRTVNISKLGANCHFGQAVVEEAYRGVQNLS